MTPYHVTTHITSCHLYSVSVMDKYIVYQWLFLKYHKMWFFSHFLPEYTYKVMKSFSCLYSKSLVITCCILLWARSGMCTNCLQHIYQNLISHKKIKFINDEDCIMLLLQLLVRICGVLLWYKSCMLYDPFMWTIEKNNFAYFSPSYTSLLTKNLLLNYYTSLVITFMAYLYENSALFPTHL